MKYLYSFSFSFLFPFSVFQVFLGGLGFFSSPEQRHHFFTNNDKNYLSVFDLAGSVSFSM